MRSAIPPALEEIERKSGFVPNVLKEIGAVSPAMLKAYTAGMEAMAGSTLDEKEQQAVGLAVSSFNSCAYCIAAHAAALRGAGVAEEDVEALAQGRRPADPKLRALSEAARLILTKKGFLGADDIDRLAAAGVGKSHIYEIIALIGLKTMTNYVNHINHTAVDPQFEG